MKILVTGGSGYIGSHTCVELIEAGHDVVIVDNLCNSSEEVVRRIKAITGMEPAFYCVDVCEKEPLQDVFQKEKPDAVIHFAGLKAVGESVEKPLEYYRNNLDGTLTLAEVMREQEVFSLIFSSSATVYGDPETIPVGEECPKGTCTNPYGWTKWMIEQILTDLSLTDSRWKITLLRYFNPIGAHSSGLIGEDPKGIPNNLLPYIAQVAVGRREALGVFGNDYDTPDGTGVRDYIHVCDLARGHLLAMEHLSRQEGVRVYNLGSGRGYSVLEVLHAFEKACGKELPYEIKPRRAGDIAAVWCDPQKAKEELGFETLYDIDRMCRDTWNWQKNNPNGYCT